jgi:hypothetical protein
MFKTGSQLQQPHLASSWKPVSRCVGASGSTASMEPPSIVCLAAKWCLGIGTERIQRYEASVAFGMIL